MAAPGDMFDTVNKSIGAGCKFGESGSCPPRQMVGRRIEQKIWDAGQRGWDVRYANEDKAAGFRRLYHLSEKGRRFPDMFENLKGTDGVVRARMLDKMLSERFVPHAIGRAAFGEVRVEPSVSRLRHA